MTDFDYADRDRRSNQLIGWTIGILGVILLTGLIILKVVGDKM